MSTRFFKYLCAEKSNTKRVNEIHKKFLLLKNVLLLHSLRFDSLLNNFQIGPTENQVNYWSVGKNNKMQSDLSSSIFSSTTH
jgi:hypothetical protein